MIVYSNLSLEESWNQIMLKQMFNFMHSYAMNVDSFFTHNNSIQIIEA